MSDLNGEKMFKENNQLALFTFETEPGEKQRNALNGSKEKWFYKLIFQKINENDFKPLYSDKASRPNTAVNILVSALILKGYKGISYDELMEGIVFDLRLKNALGLSFLDDGPLLAGIPV